MNEPLNKYIGQQYKNKQYRRKHNKRVSSILSEIKLLSEANEDDISGNKMHELFNISKEFRSDGPEIMKKRSSMVKRSSAFSETKTDNIRLSNTTISNRLSNFSNETHKMKNNVHLKKMSSFGFQNERTSTEPSLIHSQILNTRQRQNIQPKKQTSKFKQYQTKNSMCKVSALHLPKKKVQKVKTQAQSIDLQFENIHQLCSFISGGYDNQISQFSNFVNLSVIDRRRKDFYVFNRLYDEILQRNVANKMSIRDVKSQNLRDIICINEQKNHATSPEFLTAIQELKIIR